MIIVCTCISKLAPDCTSHWTQWGWPDCAAKCKAVWENLEVIVSKPTLLSITNFLKQASCEDNYIYFETHRRGSFFFFRGRGAVKNFVFSIISLQYSNKVCKCKYKFIYIQHVQLQCMSILLRQILNRTIENYMYLY